MLLTFRTLGHWVESRPGVGDFFRISACASGRYVLVSLNGMHPVSCAI